MERLDQATPTCSSVPRVVSVTGQEGQVSKTGSSAGQLARHSTHTSVRMAGKTNLNKKSSALQLLSVRSPMHFSWNLCPSIPCSGTPSRRFHSLHSRKQSSPLEVCQNGQIITHLNPFGSTRKVRGCILSFTRLLSRRWVDK